MADQATEKAESLEEAFSILSCYTYDAAGLVRSLMRLPCALSISSLQMSSSSFQLHGSFGEDGYLATSTVDPHKNASTLVEHVLE
ncbi:hypothetical protein KC354_g26 [Hortaea werneckii]|nr:hypothetical protein KC354_g26 [Hortaea werneckii]